MPRRSSKSEDPNLFAKSILDQIIAKHDPESLAEDRAIKESGKNPAAVALGRLGGKKGGLARAANSRPRNENRSRRKPPKRDGERKPKPHRYMNYIVDY
jgi:hypothetical protein